MPDFTALIGLANGIAALGVTGLLSLLFILWLTGKLHTSKEKEDWDRDVAYRETLRIEAVADRKASDDALKAALATLTETNELMRRSLDLNERLVEEYISRRTPRKAGGA